MTERAFAYTAATVTTSPACKPPSPMPTAVASRWAELTGPGSRNATLRSVEISGLMSLVDLPCFLLRNPE